MKIAVTSTGPTLDDNVEARFGRCAYFLIVDTDTMRYEAIENPNIALGGGAGIQSAQLMSQAGVTTVLTGNCGPNAFNVFGEAGIQVVVGVSGQVRSAVEQFKAGVFSSASGPSVDNHFGMDTPRPDPVPTRQRRTIPFGQGGGRGKGRAVSRGRGMGKGMGCGGGMGRCTGRGRGMRMGGGFGRRNWPALEQPAYPPESDVNPAQARVALESQLEGLERQKHQIEQRIRELEAGRRSIAVVSVERCAGCGICTDVCPENAIEINGHADVNSELCTGCGKCVSECPNGAVVLVSSKNSW